MKNILLNLIPTLLVLMIGIYLVKGNETEFTGQVNSVSDRLLSLDSKIEQLSTKLDKEKPLVSVVPIDLTEDSDSQQKTPIVDKAIESRLVMIEHQISSLLETVNKQAVPLVNNAVQAVIPPPPAPRQLSPEERQEKRQNQIQQLENKLTSAPPSQAVSETVRAKVEAIKSTNEMLTSMNNFEASCSNGMCKVEYETAAGEELSPDIVENEVALALSDDFPVSQMGSVVRTESGYKYTAYFIAPSNDETN